MPRTSRREDAGALHHVTAKSTSRRLLFNEDGDRQHYLRLLAREISRREWRMLTFCLLSNHLHLLIRTPEPDLGAGMKVIHETFARRTNRARGENGHLFGARYYSDIVKSERHVHGCLRYIAQNPTKAGICRRPADWPWSGHRALAGLSDPPSFLAVDAAHEFLGSTLKEARAAYVRLVAQSNAELAFNLARPGSDGWLVTARDDFAIPVDDLMTVLGMSKSATYARLAAARRTAVSVP
jgi:putative transposase